MHFRLNYLHHDLELTAGEFALGRSAECELSLDDPLVSRRHALLLVAKDGVTIEDLQSRNGVIVNGERIMGKLALKPGDTILIGSQALRLLAGRRPVARDQMSTTLLAQSTLPRIATAEPTAASDGTAVSPLTVLPPSPDRTATEFGADVSSERRADAFKLLGGVADKALAMGRADEAERLLASALADVLEASRSGRRPATAVVDIAARFAAKLATATAKGAWADYVIELYDTELRPCPAVVIDELYGALRKVSAIDLIRLRGYVARLRERQSSLGPAEKFLLQRIEGLERLAALR
ncbi:MAG: FHA domain-containing protein [Myxococcota bacterium]|nr:FHA domain-containing protein [Myxococcota bacterium]